MDTPIDHLPSKSPCHAAGASPAPDGAWLRALLRIFADLAFRLR